MGLTNEEKVGTLENTAAKRKEKLLALKKKIRNENQDEQHKTGDNDDEDQTELQEDLPPSQVLFRNYRPMAESLEAATVTATEPADVESQVKQQLEDGEKAKEEVQVEITNLAPKKITFDLKRGIQAQLDKLERRTDKSIAELIRQRLREGKQQDFLIAVNAGARVNQKSGFDSDED